MRFRIYGSVWLGIAVFPAGRSARRARAVRPCSGLARSTLVMWSLSLLGDLTLFRIQVIQTVIGADRTRVRGCPGGIRPRCYGRRARRTLYLTAERDTGADADAHQDDCTKGGRSLSVHHFLLSPDGRIAIAETL